MKNLKFLFLLLSTILFFNSCKKEEDVAPLTTLNSFNINFSNVYTTYSNTFLLETFNYFGGNQYAELDETGKTVRSFKLSSNYVSDLEILKNKNYAAISTFYDSTNAAGNKYYGHLLLETFNAAGNLLNTLKIILPDSSSTWSANVAEGSNNNLYISAYRYNSNYDTAFSYLIKVVNNQIVYSKKYDNVLFYANKINEINDELYLAMNGPTLAKFDASGNLIFIKRFITAPYPGQIAGFYFINNEFLICGVNDIGGIDTYNNNPFVFKTNLSGDSLNFSTFDSPKQDVVSNTFIENGDIYFIGSKQFDLSYPQNLSSMEISKFNTSSFSFEWQKMYAEKQSAIGFAGLINSEGTISLVGKKFAYGSTSRAHMLFMKINKDGSF